MSSPDEIAFHSITFHSITMPSITGEPVSFEQFRGRRCLVVNVASR